MKLRDFAPDLYVQSIYQIDIKALKARGINTVITDLDNTLVEANNPEYTPKLVKWLDDLQEQGFKVMILSNNSKIRVTEFAEAVTVPYIYRARKPLSSSYKKALKLLNSTAKESVMLGDQMMTDIFGGNRLGFHTILVSPIAEKECINTKINRKLEGIILPLLRKRGLVTWED